MNLEHGRENEEGIELSTCNFKLNTILPNLIKGIQSERIFPIIHLNYLIWGEVKKIPTYGGNMTYPLGSPVSD